MSEADNLRKLIEERGHVKGALTRFKKFWDEQGRIATIESLQERLIRNVPLIDKFDAIQDRIEALIVGTQDEDAHRQFRSVFETIYFDVIGGVRGHIQRAQAPALNINTHRTLNLTSACPTVSETASTVRLPATPVPNFHGCIGEWVYFRDSFESLVNRNEALSGMDRFHYLKSAVKGEAARALKSLPMSEDNYDAAWKLLSDRYEDTNELIDYHVGSVFDLSPMVKDSPVSLRQLLNDFSNHLRSLKSLKEPVDLWDTLLVRLLSTKLDARTSEAWEKRVSELGERKKLSDLQSFLEQRYKFIAKATRANQAVSGSPNSKFGEQKPRTRSVALVNAETGKCPLCAVGHTLAQCREFKALAINARIKKVKELRVCFNCLRGGHSFKTCTQGSCHQCQA
ncbi:hypothetical protein WN55_07287 [Dufourea novaeangliae]|uniref:CCHC-type domain-containing protein n=1 Tax=Dufourea novaeangliae TaxID=178035 RepID=A0A154P493_DUFNO|nr:hypothetical protein WN55_07287 [Dufourea novaeangliae]